MMKKTFVFMLMVPFLFAGCNLETGKNIPDLGEVTEILYVIQSEMDYISEVPVPQISYFTYINYNVSSRVDYFGEDIPENTDFIQSNIFYKHRYQIAIRWEPDKPFSIAYLEIYNQQNVYLYNVLKEIARKYEILVKSGNESISFKYDYFHFTLRLVDSRLTMEFKRIMPDGSEYDIHQEEKTALMDEIMMYDGHIEECKIHINYHEESITLFNKILQDAEYYAEYVKRKREHDNNQGKIMVIYNPAPYNKIKRIIDEDSDILANKDMYTPDYLRYIKSEISEAKSNIEMYNQLIADEKVIIDSLNKRYHALF